jgi:hypothetical protein
MMATDLELKMLAKGYASSRMVARKTGRHFASVLRLCKTGGYEGTKVGNQYFILISSVLAHHGESSVQLLDLHDWSDVFEATPPA